MKRMVRAIISNMVPHPYLSYFSRFGLVLVLLPFSSQAAPSATSRGRSWTGSYNSDESGLSDQVRNKPPVIYTLRQLEKLRRALPPRYVRVTDWRHYATSGRILNRGILFTYAGFRARKAFIAGNFSNWRLLPMNRNTRGLYYYILPIHELEKAVPGKVIDYRLRYKYRIDGSWIHDPVNRNRDDDGLGAYVSSYQLFSRRPDRYISVHKIGRRGSRAEREVEFAIYLPDVKNLSLVGTFNNWNPEHDIPIKGPDGIFRLRLRMGSGQYMYKYIADGRRILDKYNPHTRLFKDIGEICSYLKIE